MNLSYDGIHEVKGFLSEDEVDSLLLFTAQGNFVESHPGNIIQELHEEALKITDKINKRVISYFENAQAYIPITNIRRLQEGESMKSHADRDPNTKDTIVFGVVIYLNDDFTGGELRYPDLDIEIKPTRATMLVHKSELQHEVLPVLSGTRYSMTTFIFGDSLTTFKP